MKSTASLGRTPCNDGGERVCLSVQHEVAAGALRFSISRFQTERIVREFEVFQTEVTFPCGW